MTAAQADTPLRINNPVNAGRGADIITIGKDGTVYVCWAGVTNTSPFAEILAGFAKSSNGGQNFLDSSGKRAFEMSAAFKGNLPRKPTFAKERAAAHRDRQQRRRAMAGLILPPKKGGCLPAAIRM
ncbi:MAG: hypothetical protein R3C41_21005 [Calditrichia bacterium]